MAIDYKQDEVHFIELNKLRMNKRIARAAPELAIFFECDVQQKMAPHIKGFDIVAHNSARMA